MSTTTKIVLDCRATRPGQAAPLKLSVCHRRRTFLISLDVRITPGNWDASRQIAVRYPRAAQLNAYLGRVRNDADRALLSLMDGGELSSMSAGAVRDYIRARVFPDGATHEAENPATFGRWFKRFAERKAGRTRALYEATYKRLCAYCSNVDSISFEAVNRDWLERFDAFLAETSPSANARNIHLRNVRAVFNDAIDNDVTAAYPFRRLKLRPEPTRKRNFGVETLRSIFSAEGLELWEQKYLDFLKLTFMLIGINVVDLCRLREVRGGRVEYVRAKTHRAYSVKVEPEAMAIIERWRGEGWLLCYLDTVENYRSFYSSLVKGLRSICCKLQAHGLAVGELTTYWMRHSWATIAASLDVPRDTIAAALGHGGRTVTDIYIERDPQKVDEANRRVLDWVLYGRR